MRCDDVCTGQGDADHWRWTAQLVLAAIGFLLGASALVLGFTSRTRTYQLLLVTSLGCALLWLGWVLGGQGGF